MKEKIKEIASRIRELRDLSGISIDEMANRMCLPTNIYQKYEGGDEDIPASILLKISHVLNVDMTILLTGEEPRMHIFTITRKGKGVQVERRKQYKYENLVEKFIHKKAEFFIVSVEPRKDRKKPMINSHPGQEFNYVLEGSVKIYIHNNEIVLKEGDSIFFDSGYGHAMEALNGKNAKFLAAIL